MGNNHTYEGIMMKMSVKMPSCKIRLHVSQGQWQTPVFSATGKQDDHEFVLLSKMSQKLKQKQTNQSDVVFPLPTLVFENF